jgi:phospholipid/cholesterol/gamma-HCH transport system ATP-binding protein
MVTTNAPQPQPASPTTGTPIDPAAALSLRDVECRYGERVILSGVTFDVAPGEIFFIAGGSGCGKSTLLKNVVGLIEPAKGSVAFLGQPITGVTGHERRAIQSSLGVLYQSGALWSSMTLLENIELPLEAYTDLSASERRQLAMLKLALVGLADAGHRYPAELSGGMKKRAGLARALALDPRIVFFDEPSAGLDPVTSRQLDALVREVRDHLGMTMVIVSHELDSIFGIGERMVVLDKSVTGVIALGKPRELATQPPHPTVRDFLTRGGERAVPPS